VSGTARVVSEEFAAARGDTWSSKDMLELIRRKSQGRTPPSLLGLRLTATMPPMRGRPPSATSPPRHKASPPRPPTLEHPRPSPGVSLERLSLHQASRQPSPFGAVSQQHSDQQQQQPGTQASARPPVVLPAVTAAALIGEAQSSVLQPSSAVQPHQRAVPASNAAAPTTEEDVTAHVGHGTSEGAPLPVVEWPGTGADPDSSSPTTGHPSVHWADQQPNQQQQQQEQPSRQLNLLHSGSMNAEDANAGDVHMWTTPGDSVAAVLPTTTCASLSAAANDGLRASVDSNPSNTPGTGMTGGTGIAEVPGSQVELPSRVPTAQSATLGDSGVMFGIQGSSPPALTYGPAGSEAAFDRLGVPQLTPLGGSPPVSPTAPRHFTSHTHSAAASAVGGAGLPRHKLRRAVTEPRRRWSSAGAVGGDRALSRLAGGGGLAVERSHPSAASSSPPDTDAGSTDGHYAYRSGDGSEAVRGWSTEVGSVADSEEGTEADDGDFDIVPGSPLATPPPP